MEKYYLSLRKNRILLSLVLTLAIVIVGVGVWISYINQLSYIQTDVLVYGSTLGGSASAITLGDQGIKTVLVAEGDEVGGQSVSSGLSAMDESGRGWENYGIYYDLKQYVKAKYNLPDGRNYGLGDAVVGSLTTLPSDIEEFLVKRMADSGKVQLLKSYKLKQVLQSATQTYSEAIIENTKAPFDQKIVRFKYIIDGTQTGKVLSQVGANYSVGFDTQEETAEPSALPSLVKDYFVNGYTDKAKRYGEFGNRTQALTTVFSVYDKGYRGEFYGAETTDEGCWENISTGNFIKGSKMYRSKASNCQIKLEITPQFTDTYSIGFVNHGATNTNIQILMGDDKIPYQINPAIDPGQSINNLIKLALNSQEKIVITLTAPQAGYVFEGYIFSKSNINQAPFDLIADGDNSFKFNNNYGRDANAMVYLRSQSPLPFNRIKINGQDVALQGIGTQTYQAQIKVAQQPYKIDLPTKQGIEMDVTPLGFNNSGAIEFLYENNTDQVGKWSKGTSPDGKANHVAMGKSILQWEFTAPNSGEYIVMSDWFPFRDRTDKASVKLLAADGSQVARSVFDQKVKQRTDLVPIMMVKLNAGQQYKVRIENYENAILDFSELQLIPVSGFNGEYIAGKTVDIKNPSTPDIYDVWVKVNEPGNVETTTAERKQTLKIKDATSYKLVGRYFFGGDRKLSLTSDRDLQVLVIPQSRIDVAHKVLQPVNGELNIGNFDAGRYQMVITGGDIGAIVPKQSDPKITSQWLSTDNDSVQINKFYTHGGGDLKLKFDGLDNNSLIDVYLYDAIPEAYSTQYFDATMPLLKPTQAGIQLFRQQTFFNFRNIISPENLVKRDWGESYGKYLGTNTLGVSMVNTPFNDFAPVFTQSIDDPEVASGSKDFSYSYYYWLRYDLPQQAETLGCDPATILCDSRRVRMATNLFGTTDGFPKMPYIREGRRIKTLAPITEQSIILNYINCRADQCTPVNCYAETITANNCIAKAQSPLLDPDALAAVYYEIDIHSFFSREESIGGGLQQFLDYVRSTGLVNANDSLIFNRSYKAKPAQITLGSLIPEQGNLFPASTNFGTTQITNGYFRTHNIELAIGTSTGNLIAFALKNNVTPQAIYADSSLKLKLQTELIARDERLYQVDGFNYNDKLLTRAVQYMILRKFVTPAIEITPPSTILYTLDNSKPIDASDNELVKALGLESAPKNLLDLINLLEIMQGKSVTEQNELVDSLGIRPGVKSESDLSKVSIIKADLYKVAYLKLNETAN